VSPSSHSFPFSCTDMHLDPTSIAAGQNTTLFLAHPNDKYSDMPRHPVDLVTPQVCVGCGKDDGDPLECDKVCFRFLLPPRLPSVMIMGACSVTRRIILGVLTRHWMRCRMASGSAWNARVNQGQGLECIKRCH
jgi:hypothetical protein